MWNKIDVSTTEGGIWMYLTYSKEIIKASWFIMRVDSTHPLEVSKDDAKLSICFFLLLFFG